MLRPTRLLTCCYRFSVLTRVAGELVKVGRHPGTHTQDPRAIKRHELRRLLALGAQVHDHVVLMLQPLQPPEAPAEDFHLRGQACLDGVLPSARVRLPVRSVGREAVVMQLTEPHGDLTRLLRLEQLMDTGGTQAGGTRRLTDGQTGFWCRDNGPDPFAIGVCKPRGREAEPGAQLLFATDTRSPCLRVPYTRTYAFAPKLSSKLNAVSQFSARLLLTPRGLLCCLSPRLGCANLKEND